MSSIISFPQGVSLTTLNTFLVLSNKQQLNTTN